jgi:uroporphyrinogen-III synthase
MHLLLTRPELDAEGSRDRLIALGYEVTVAPLIQIRMLEHVPLPDLPWQAVLVTSGNGARALGQHEAAAKLHNLPVLAVGEQSAMRMRAQGFTNVLSADGDAEALAQLAHIRLDPANGPVLHVAGSVRAGDLAAMLGDQFALTRVVLYEAEPVMQVPQEILTGLQNAAFDGVLFYSPRSARVFKELIIKAQLERHLARMTAYCLSARVKQSLPDGAFRSVRIAKEPKEASLLSLIVAD